MKRTKEEAEKTKEKILHAALDVFIAKGVADATLNNIAETAHVTRGAVYHYFENKNEIFDALSDRLHKPFIAHITNALEENHPEPLQQLRDICIKLLCELETDEFKRKTLILFHRRCDYTGELACCRDKYLAKKTEKQEVFEKYFEAAKAKGKLPPETDSALLTNALGCYMKGILYEYLDAPDKFNLAQQAPALINVFFKKDW